MRSEEIYEAFRKFLASRLRIVGDDTVHVGEVCGCPRKAYFTRKYGSKDLSHIAPSKRVVLGLGLSTHLVLEKVLEELGYTTEHQVIIELDGFKLAGTPDAVSNSHVVEIKTVNRVPDEPFPNHVMQLNAYLGLLRKSTGYIVYICRRDGQVKVFPHSFSEVMFREVLKRAAKLYRHIREDTVPEAEPSYLCNYCEWKWKCLNSGRGDEE